ncbi:class F sortase [Rhodococcus sp. NPDC060090]|uniref:class F sortase n=1 Tax=Rhodococcus sp. NPDC060090 TaxID=3347056 RepID=UPI0036469AA3
MRSRTVVAALAGVALLLVGGCADGAEDAAPAAPSTQQEPGKHDMPPPVEVIADDPSAPVTLTIGDESAPTDPVATDTAGVLLPPQDVGRLGWWADSSPPGSGAGSIVVTGHVDDVAQGDGFATRFADLSEGDEVALSLNDGSARKYRVDRLLSVGKDGDLPLDELNRLDGPETLVLVTCGGEFVGPPLGYADNDFVFASPLA